MELVGSIVTILLVFNQYVMVMLLLVEFYGIQVESLSFFVHVICSLALKFLFPKSLKLLDLAGMVKRLLFEFLVPNPTLFDVGRLCLSNLAFEFLSPE